MFQPKTLNSLYRRGVSQQIGRAFFKVTAKVVEAVINVLNLQLGAETANQLLQKMLWSRALLNSL